MAKLWLLTALAYTASAWAQAPAIASGGVANFGNRISQGLPGHGVARGSLFAVTGTNLGPADAARAELPLTTLLGGTGVKVTVGGTTVDAWVVFASAREVVALLPSNSPAGEGTVTVSYAEQTSATAPVQVVEAGFGVFTTGVGGVGAALARSQSGEEAVWNGLRESARSGQTVSFLGTGLGPVEGDETAAASQAELPRAIEAWVGNQRATVAWRGRAGTFPGNPALPLPAGVAGVDRVDVTIPESISGCNVAVAFKVGDIVGNFATISVGPDKVCRDENGLTGDELSRLLQTEGTTRVGTIGLARTSVKASFQGQSVDTKSDIGVASFWRYDARAIAGSQGAYNFASAGGCTVFTFAGRQAPQVAQPGGPEPVMLDAGAALTVNGPGGAKRMARKEGVYTEQFAQSISLPVPLPFPIPGIGGALYLEPGSYTVEGPGGADVGAFRASIQIVNPLVWSNQDQITSVTRSEGVTVRWTGGDASTQVTIIGSSSNASATGVFLCGERAGAGQFAVPSFVLQRLPASAGETGGILNVTNTKIATFTAPNLDAGYITADVVASKTVPYR